MKLLRNILLLLLSFCLLAPGVVPAQAAAAGAKVVFLASSPDGDGYFTVSVTVYDAVFEGVQFAIEFNADAVTPASWMTGDPTASVSNFAKKETVAENMSFFGNITKENKMILLGYSEHDPDFSIVAGTNGVKLLSIRFKVIGEGISGLCIKDEAGENCLSFNYSSVPSTFLFEVPEKLNGGTASSETTETKMTKAARAKDTIVLQIGNYAAAKDGALCHIYPGEKLITPYTQADETGNGRTMVPVRFVAEQLGAAVGWENDTRTVTITTEESVVIMTIGSGTYTVNGAAHTMDAAAEIKDCGDGSGSGRTMVPLRFVAEALGKSVYWDQENKLVMITGPDAPWQADRAAEEELTQDVLLIISPLLRDLAA